MTNFIAVHGNAIVPDSSDPLVVKFTDDGADVTPIPGSSTGTFNCSLPSSLSGITTAPTNVQIEIESKLTNITGVTLWSGNALVASIPGPGPILANAQVALIPTPPPGTIGLGWNLRVTLGFTNPGLSSATIVSLAIFF